MRRRVSETSDLYGEITGETDEFGLPVRANWADGYRRRAMVVYGHTSVVEPSWLNRTINIDTGCLFAGKPTALRYPEKVLVSVLGTRVHHEPARPLVEIARLAESFVPSADRSAHQLFLDDVIGKRVVSTRLRANIKVREENAAAALEVMSRCALDPRRLVYLPPTISPCETFELPGLLEHPAQVFTYFRNNGVSQVVCEEKHMGSRAVVMVGQDAAATDRCFGIAGEGVGACYTRTGRRFFDDRTLEAQFLGRIRTGLGDAGLRAELGTDWVVLDSELMPWSLKAQALLREQYASVGAAARTSHTAAASLLRQANDRGIDAGDAFVKVEERLSLARLYSDSYALYCWPVTSLTDIQFAPVHLLASEGQVHNDKNHLWHMEVAARLHKANSALFRKTRHKVVCLDNEEETEATRWWEELTGQCGEGMVIKPLAFVAKGKWGLVQPAVKCRGTEYLRIIYEPEYTVPENLEYLRNRGLSRKRSLALR